MKNVSLVHVNNLILQKKESKEHHKKEFESIIGQMSW